MENNMEKNLFEELQAKKEQLGNFAKTALEKKWISQDVYDGIIGKLKNDKLTIGVIGQMKCGKSTFLNAFVFEDEVLPAATTPMTAALSVITYGDKEEIEVEFYTTDEWEELRFQAEMDLEDAKNDSITSSKIKAAKELMDKSRKIADIESLLGKTQSDSLNNLVEYVGANGRYVALTKSVTIYYPKQWLKGVEIVDTPGFNDPVVSREVRTQEFLKKADVVLLLLYAGRAFDATDRDIVFEKVRNVGVGKILIGVNKYDLCYEKGETEEEIIENVTNEIKKACREYRDSSVSELLKKEKPVLFSASMALMAKMPMERLRNNEDYNFHWKRICDIFEITTQRQMFEKSLIADIEGAVRMVVEKSKDEILFRKPVNMVSQAVVNAKEQVDRALNENKELLKSLELPDNELEERIDNLNKVQKRIKRKIERITLDLSERYEESINSIIKKLEDITRSAEKELHKIIDDEKRTSVQRSEQSRIKTLNTELESTIKKGEKELGNIIIDAAEEFRNEVEDIVNKYINEPEDLLDDFSLIIKQNMVAIKNQVDNAMQCESEQNEEGGFIRGILKTVLTTVLHDLNPAAWVVDRLMYKKECHEEVTQLFEQIDFSKQKNILLEKKQAYINMLGTVSVEKVVSSLVNELEEARKNRDMKDKKIDDLRVKIESMLKEQKDFEKQVEEMKALSKGI